MDAFKRKSGNVFQCQRCGYEIKSTQSPYYCFKCRNLNKTKLEMDYFDKHEKTLDNK